MLVGRRGLLAMFVALVVLGVFALLYESERQRGLHLERQVRELQDSLSEIQHSDQDNFLRTSIKRNLQDAGRPWVEIVEGTDTSTHPSSTTKLIVAPSFLLLGVPKAASTTLFKWLTQHPSITAQSKEYNFWNRKSVLGFLQDLRRDKALLQEYYKLVGVQLFPPAPALDSITSSTPSSSYIHSGDGSVLSIMCPLLPPVFATLLPQMKYVVVLRDPLERIYSHFLFINQRIKDKTQLATLFAFTIDKELDYLRSCHRPPNTTSLSQHNQPPPLPSLDLFKDCYISSTLRSTCDLHACPLCHNILSMSMYARLLQMWWAYIPRDRFLLLRSEELKLHPEAVLDSVLHFLGIPILPPETFQWEVDKSFLVRSGEATARTLLDLDGRNKHLEKTLIELFRPHNELLWEQADIRY